MESGSSNPQGSPTIVESIQIIANAYFSKSSSQLRLGLLSGLFPVGWTVQTLKTPIAQIKF